MKSVRSVNTEDLVRNWLSSTSYFRFTRSENRKPISLDPPGGRPKTPPGVYGSQNRVLSLLLLRGCTNEKKEEREYEGRVSEDKGRFMSFVTRLPCLHHDTHVFWWSLSDTDLSSGFVGTGGHRSKRSFFEVHRVPLRKLCGLNMGFI